MSASSCVAGGLTPGLPLGGGHWLLGPTELQGALLGAQETSHHPELLPFLLQQRFCAGPGLVGGDRQTEADAVESGCDRQSSGTGERGTCEPCLWRLHFSIFW